MMRTACARIRPHNLGLCEHRYLVLVALLYARAWHFVELDRARFPEIEGKKKKGGNRFSTTQGP